MNVRVMRAARGRNGRIVQGNVGVGQELDVHNVLIHARQYHRDRNPVVS